jgi:4'-phosphopantetheinyl transferase
MAGHLIPQQEPHKFRLAADELHIWYITAHGEYSHASCSALEACLNPQELNRYHRLTRPNVRRNFLLSRGCLRHLLGLYLDSPPRNLQFSLGPYGKPELVHGVGQPPLQFNLSHTQGRIAIALHRHQAVGIDIEQLRSVTYLDQLCRRCLTDQEAQTVLTLEDQPAQHRFLRYWTAKEAILKAVGLGLSYPMNQLEVTLCTDDLPSQPVEVPIAPSTFHGQAPDFGPCKLYQWQPEADYVAALAIQGPFPESPLTISRQQITPQEIVEAFV